MNARLRVGVIGLGVGEQHLLAFERDARCDVVAVADLSTERLARVAGGRPQLTTTTDAAELIALPGLDVVSIASYDDAHFEQARTALQAGRHVFVEKPLARTLDELRTLKDAAAERPGIVLTSNLVLRSAPLFRRLRADVHGGALGRLYAFDGDYLYGRLHKITDGWRRDVPDYSVMLGGGVHLVDLMLWTTGERPTRVFAAGNRISTEGTAFAHLDFVAATFEFTSGLVGRITANFGSVQPHRHVVRAFGTESTFVSDDRGARVFRTREPDTEPERLALPADAPSKGALVPDFVQTIFGEDGARTASIQHELDVIAACIAADRAIAERGGPVDIEFV
jgi:predicted dehydrogenase